MRPSNPRIEELKEELIAACLKSQDDISSVRPPKPELKKEYATYIERLEAARGAPLWFPYLGTGRGCGPLVELLDGSVKYDFITGIGVHFFGHSHPKILKACIDGALSDISAQGNLQQNDDQNQLMQKFVAISGLDHVFLTTSGSMAVENGLKIAFQKKQPASRIIAFEGCFCGRTLATSTISDKPGYRVGLPPTLSVDYIPFFDHNDPKGSLNRAMAALEKILFRYPKQHAAMLFELVQGEGGFWPGTAEFFRPLMEKLKSEGILVLVDEVQTFGRTSDFFAFQHFGLQDLVDIVTIGKLSLVCATLYRKDLAPKSGLLSQTFTGATSQIKASLAILDMLEHGFFGPNGKNSAINAHFVKKMEAMRKKYPEKIKGPYGIGALCAFTPLDGTQSEVVRFVKTLFENGVMSFITGGHPTRCRFLMPVGVVSVEDIDNVLLIVEETLRCM